MRTTLVVLQLPGNPILIVTTSSAGPWSAEAESQSIQPGQVSPLPQFLSVSYASLLPYTSQTGLLGTDVRVVHCIEQT